MKCYSLTFKCVCMCDTKTVSIDYGMLFAIYMSIALNKQ